MTSIEIQRAINEFISLYPNYYRNLSPDSMHNIMKSWERRFEKVEDYKTFIDAMYEYDSKSDYPNPPTTKQLLDMYNVLRSRKKSGSARRIETPEEVMANMFHEEMAKPHDKRDYDLLERTKYYANLFQDPDAYKKHFGKSREEFEKL